MKILLTLLLLMPSFSWSKDIYLSCNIISKKTWGEDDYRTDSFYDKQRINLLIKNKSLIIDDYELFTFTYDGREVDGNTLIGENNDEYYFKKMINKSSEDDVSITYTHSRVFKNIGENMDSDVTYNFQFIINKYTLDTEFREFWSDLIERSEGSVTTNNKEDMLRTNNYRMKCESKKSIL